MSGSCPVSAHVCREAAKERDELRRWKTEALPVLDGLQELGKALGLPLGSRIAGQEALAAVERLTRERDDDRRVADIAVDQKRRLLRERDEARAEVERLRAGIEALADEWQRIPSDGGYEAACEDHAREALALLNPTEGENR